MPISEQAAYDATDPNLSEDDRLRSAQVIMASVAANDAYWDSRGPLEQVIARAQGHGQVPGSGDNAGQLTQSDAPTAIDTTATPTPPAVTETSGDSDTSVEDKLRAQIESLGGTPEA